MINKTLQLLKIVKLHMISRFITKQLYLNIYTIYFDISLFKLVKCQAYPIHHLKPSVMLIIYR